MPQTPETESRPVAAPADESARGFAGVDRERLGIGFIVAVIVILAAVVALIAARFVIGAGLLVIAVMWFALFRLGNRRDSSRPIDIATNADSVRRVLVLSHEGLAGEDLQQAIEGRSAEHGRLHVRVLVPALASAIDHIAGDVDAEIDDAAGGGERIAASLRESGVEADAATGDSDSEQALEDELATYPADEIIVVNPRESEMSKLERAATSRAQDGAPIPVTEFHV